MKRKNIQLRTPQYVLIDELGTKYYYRDRKMTICHREDGPAVEWVDGTKSWWIEGRRVSEEEFNKRTKFVLGKTVIVDGVEYTLS
jgi:hypothetical protein